MSLQRIIQVANFSRKQINIRMVKSDMSGKYSLLKKYLTSLPDSQNNLTLSFNEIDHILNDKLPYSAHQYREWWENETEGSHVQAQCWMDAGWSVDTVDFNRKSVKLVRKGKR
jgi:hypothetical protein